MAPLHLLRAELLAARKAAAACPVVDLKQVRELNRLANQVGAIAARRLVKGG